MQRQERDSEEFAIRLRAWLRGDDGPDAEAAGMLVADTLLMFRAVLDGMVKRGE